LISAKGPFSTVQYRKDENLGVNPEIWDMFTGIIENTGTITGITTTGGNKTFLVSSPLAAELKVDQSLSHDGVCLTVEAVRGNSYQVTAIAETLSKTNLGGWEAGTVINLERCMLMNGRLDGHIVQGHVDCTAECTGITEKQGSWEYRFRFPASFTNRVIEKGSISINGISLTLFDVG
jgi:riboflavin synthase